MALNQSDRIVFSRFIVNSGPTIEGIQRAMSETMRVRDNALALDQGNMRLFDSKNRLVDGYQNELKYLTGIDRVRITEQVMIDSANFVLGNLLYPNNAITPPPSIAPNIWTKLRPYSKTAAVGKTLAEVFPAVDPAIGEEPLINSILSQITSAQGTYASIELTTGEYCADGTCSNPSYNNSSSCVMNGGTWTPAPASFDTYPAVHSVLSSIQSNVNALRAALVLEQAAILTDDPNLTRQAQNNAAIAAIPAVIAAIDTWLAYPDFNTAHGATTCNQFYAMDGSTLAPTKLYSGQLNALYTSLSNRLTAVGVRVSEINTNLGVINQNLTDGSFTGNGLYYERFQFIDLRLNLVFGSLTEYLNYGRSVDNQGQLLLGVEQATAVYETLLLCSILAAPTNGTNTLNVKDATGFSVGDNVFIKSDTQEELVRSIEAISGNRITVGQTIPAKYRPGELARVYKDIS